jgi:hypothetical protein
MDGMGGHTLLSPVKGKARPRIHPQCLHPVSVVANFFGLWPFSESHVEGLFLYFSRVA